MFVVQFEGDKRQIRRLNDERNNQKYLSKVIALAKKNRNIFLLRLCKDQIRPSEHRFGEILMDVRVCVLVTSLSERLSGLQWLSGSERKEELDVVNGLSRFLTFSPLTFSSLTFSLALQSPF